MANAINLSKDWKLARALGILRVLVDQISPDETQNLDLIDILHLSICDVAELLSAASYPDYGVKATVTQTNNIIALTSLRIDSISELYDATNGLCIEVDPKEFENLITIPQRQGLVSFYQFGEYLYLYKPTALSYGTLTLSYNRIPKKVTDLTDTIDIKDKYVKLALDKAKIMIYEVLKKAAPETLTNNVNNAIAQLRKSNLEELQTVKG